MSRIKRRNMIRKIFHDTTYELRRELNDCKSILDVGCGSSSPINSLSLDFYSVGTDVFEPTVQKDKQKQAHNECFLMNALDIGKRFKQKSFDAVIALELIEHLEKKDGFKLMEMMEEIAKKKVVISTPNGFLHQRTYDGNMWQIHKSGWNVKEMREKGYRVIGIGGWKPLRGGTWETEIFTRESWMLGFQYDATVREKQTRKSICNSMHKRYGARNLSDKTSIIR